MDLAYRHIQDLALCTVYIHPYLSIQSSVQYDIPHALWWSDALYYDVTIVLSCNGHSSMVIVVPGREDEEDRAWRSVLSSHVGMT